MVRWVNYQMPWNLVQGIYWLPESEHYDHWSKVSLNDTVNLRKPQKDG